MTKEMLADGFKAAQFTVTSNIEGVTHKKSIKQPPTGGNCMNWLAGHILAARGGILKLMGEDAFLNQAEAQPYRRGANRIKPGDQCVDFERIREGLEETTPAILRTLAKMTDKNLDQALEAGAFPVPVDHPSLGTMLTLILFHEGYHSGQLGMCRRVIGMRPVVK